MSIKVAINGYGTIGKRVADAVDAQGDMEIIGVTKTRPAFGCDLAVRKGYPLYCTYDDPDRIAAFAEAGYVSRWIERFARRCGCCCRLLSGEGWSGQQGGLRECRRQIHLPRRGKTRYGWYVVYLVRKPRRKFERSGERALFLATPRVSHEPLSPCTNDAARSKWSAP